MTTEDATTDDEVDFQDQLSAAAVESQQELQALLTPGDDTPTEDPEGYEPDEGSGDDQTEDPVDEVVEEPEEDTEPEPVDLPSDALVEVDGELLTLEELRNGYRRESDYTQKQQIRAEKEREAEAKIAEVNEFWQRANENPQQVIAAVANTTSDPVETVTDILRNTSKPTGAVARIIYSLAQSGSLDEQFVQRLNLSEDVIPQGEQEDLRAELERTKQEVQSFKEQQAEEQARQQAVEKYSQQWEQVKQLAGATYNSQAEENHAELLLLKYADAHGIPNLVQAYKVFRAENMENQRTQKTPQDPEPSVDEVVEKKRRTQAANSKPNAGAAPKPKRYEDTGDAAREVLKEMGISV